MPPVSSAFAMYQEKRMKRQRRLNKKKKLHLKKVTASDSLAVESNGKSDGHIKLPPSNAKNVEAHREVDTITLETDGEDVIQNSVMHKAVVSKDRGKHSVPKKKKKVQPALKNLSAEIIELNGGTDEEEDGNSVAYRKVHDRLEEDVTESQPTKKRAMNDVNQEEVTDSVTAGQDLFSNIIRPMPVEEFMQKIWEAKPLHVQRDGHKHYYSDLLSINAIDAALNGNYLTYGKNIDITHYTDGKRETLNPSGRATSKQVWDFYNQGCSVRMLNPQAFIPPIGTMLATLQEYFGVFVGANIYLTPPNAQGFAPHYDDIEAFVLQVEGKKRWKIYRPWSEEQLPRDSSRDYRPEELSKPELETVLNAGELLYFPRGWIHEAHTVPGYHSLHITVSCYQHQAWIDFFEKVFSAGLTLAAEQLDFRRGLPVGYLRYMGLVNSDQPSAGRDAFLAQFKELVKKLIQSLPVDACVDQLGRQFMHDALPPMLQPEEMKQSIYGVSKTVNPDGQIVVGRKLNKNMKIKLVRACVLRLVSEDDSQDMLQLYYSAMNSVVYHDSEEHMLEISQDEAVMVECLINNYPLYIRIGDLHPPHGVSIDEKVQLAEKLFNRGILLVTK